MIKIIRQIYLFADALDMVESENCCEVLQVSLLLLFRAKNTEWKALGSSRNKGEVYDAQ